MQDLNQSTADSSLSGTTEPPSPGIAVPDIVAQAILLELDPRDPSTVPMLLNFRYISRSFRDASWKRSAPVWRPLLRRWTVGEPEYTKLPNASDQILMESAINPAKPSKTPYQVYRARTLVDRIALAAAARRGDSVEKQDRIESHDTIAMLGTQVYDAIIRLKTVSREERHDYLSIRRVAHELEPSLTRGISMELWRNAFDDKQAYKVTIDAMAKSLAPFGTPWKTFDECHLSALLDVESFRLLATSHPPDRLVPAESMSVMLAAVIERLPAPYTMKARMHFAPRACPTVHVASKDDPSGAEHWYMCGVTKGGVQDRWEMEKLLAGEPEDVQRAHLDPSDPSELCIAMTDALMYSGDVGEDGNRRVLSNSMISFTLAALPAVTTKLSKLPKAESAQLSKEFPTYFPLEEVLTAVFSVYPHDAFLVRKHFHALLSVPAHLDKFDASFEDVLPTREIGGIPFDSDQTVAIDPEVKSLLAFKVGEACIIRSGGNEEFGVVVGWFIDENEEDGLRVADASFEEQKSQLRYRILTKTSGVNASADELHRIKPSEKRRWQRARKVIESGTMLGEWFSSRSTLEYPTYNKTKAWAAVYPEDY
ncbi:hypothetical protein RQP46_003260 [Phenoliferia psychrophenolica]